MNLSRSRTSRTLLVATAAGAVIGAMTLAGGAATRAQAAATAVNPITFASPTVVDNYRPGFEPDVAVDRSPGDSKILYTSTPFGFSTTQSFIESSNDLGDSFHLTAGNIAGKPANCIGGGDTEAQVDPISGSLYFADLQGLTNYSASRSDNHGGSFDASCASVNGTAVDRQWIGQDNNGNTTAVGPGAGDGRLYFDYDNVEQSTGMASAGSNQLVLNESLDGVQYGSLCAGTTTATGTSSGSVSTTACAGPPVVISDSEGLPGNLIVDNTKGGKFEHSVYAVHSNSGQTANVLSYCRGADSGVPASAAAAATYCTDPTTFSTTDTSRLSTHWHDVNVDLPNAAQVDKAFDVITADDAGNLYVTWAAAPIDQDASGNTEQTAPAQVYMAESTDGGADWSPRVKVNTPAQATNIFPWITAGDPGHVDIAWYGSALTTGVKPFDSDSLNNGLWDVWLAQTSTALTSAPTFSVVKVSDHYVKYGNISTGGLGGASDRSLGDYMQVQTGLDGQAILSYVDDTSNGRNLDVTDDAVTEATTGPSGQDPPEAAGPTMIAKQIGGPSLFTAKGDLGSATAAIDDVSAPTGNAFLSQGTTTTPAAANQDITGVAVSRPDAGDLNITMTTNDPTLAKDLSISPTLLGTTAVWQVRWAARYLDPAKTPDGLIYDVGMQSTNGGAPSFFTGTTGCIATTRCKYFTYPATLATSGKIVGNAIQWTVPLAEIGAPVNGNTLYSVTGTTASQATPSMATVVTLPTTGDPSTTQLPNTLDEAPSFSYTLRAATVGAPATIPGQNLAALNPTVTTKKASTTKKTVKKAAKKTVRTAAPVQPKRTLAFTGLSTGIPVLALLLASLALVLRRRSRRA